MKAYISLSLVNRISLDKEIAAIIETLKEYKILSFVFLDQYKFEISHEKEMMKHAMNEIDHCDLLIAETSDKGIGIGVEVGYAKAKGKKVIYLRRKDAEHSTTVSGISDFQIIYDDLDDLQKQLASCCECIVG